MKTKTERFKELIKDLESDKYKSFGNGIILVAQTVRNMLEILADENQETQVGGEGSVPNTCDDCGKIGVTGFISGVGWCFCSECFGKFCKIINQWKNFTNREAEK